MRREEVETAVVHVAEHLGRALRERLLARFHDDTPALASSGPQPIAEGRETDLQAGVRRRHVDSALEREELVIPYRGEPQQEPATIRFRDGQLDCLHHTGRDQSALLDRPAGARDLEQQLLLREPRVHEHARRLARRDRGTIDGEDGR